MFVDGKVGQELIDLSLAYFCCQAFVVKEDEPPHPVDLGFLGLVAGVSGSGTQADLIQEFGLAGRTTVGRRRHRHLSNCHR